MGVPFAPRAFAAFRLNTFTEEELRATFQKLDRNGDGHLSREEVLEVFQQARGDRDSGPAEAHAEQMTSTLMRQLDRNDDDRISLEEFQAGITAMAEARDRRIWPIVGIMLVCGLSVGVVIPAMPILVKLLGLSQAEFGYMVSAFGLSKLLTNVPAGLYVDTSGRRAAMVAGLAFNSVGYAGMGMVQSLAPIIGLRFVSGIGACFIMAGSITAAVDLSTPANRARMIAPVMTAFSAGTVLGPAVGGVMVGSLGLEYSFALVGGMFLANAIAARIFLPETLPAEVRQAGDNMSAAATVRGQLAQWRPMVADPAIREILGVNVAYWVALSGGQMTLLPLLLSDHFALTTAEIGYAFAWQSLISVALAGPAATAADRLGPDRVIAPALAIMAASLVAIPLAPGNLELAAALAGMAAGSTALSTAPSALVSNLVEARSRAQALSLTRTMGDVGWLMGGVGVGLAATYAGTGLALQGLGSFLLSAAGLFAFRVAARRRANV